jgi:hypothetical protein
MIISNLKDEVVGEDKRVNFIYLQNNELWYKTTSGFEFPVPVADTEGAKFLSEDRAMLFMKWIRKHIERLKKEDEEQPVGFYMHPAKYAMISGYAFPPEPADEI